MKGSAGEREQELFDELRALLAVHETAEEMVLRSSRSATSPSAGPWAGCPAPLASLVDRTRDAISKAMG